MPDPRDPRGLDLDELLGLLPELDTARLLSISAAYRTADPEQRDASREAARRVAAKRHKDDALDELRGSIAQWAAADLPRPGVVIVTGFADDLVLADLRQQAMPALLDAATVLLLGRALGKTHRDVLLGPLRSAIAEA